MLELVRGNPMRLAVLLVATIARVPLHGARGWVILRASASPITPNGALAVETFSRVASFASAFIPANLGALEASSLAAVAAIGAAGGGAALALARRLRGLFWAGLGLAIYPRARRTASTADAPNAHRPAPEPPSRRCSICRTTTTSRVAVGAACRPADRRARAASRAQRAGYTRIVIWAARAHRQCRASEARRLRRIVRDLGGRSHDCDDTHDEWQRGAFGHSSPPTPVTAIGAGTVVSPALLAAARALCRGDRTTGARRAGRTRLARKRRAARAGGPRQRSASAIARRTARARTRALSAAVRPRRVERPRTARPAHHDARRSRRRPSRRSAARATRTPTPSSRASTAGSRCQSASR